MKILTLDDRTYKLEKIPEWVDEKLRFAVLDNSDPNNPDFFYIPLIFLESFNAPAAVLEIGDHKIKMPLDWKMLIGEAGQSEMHVLPGLLTIRQVPAHVQPHSRYFQQPWLAPRGEATCNGSDRNDHQGKSLPRHSSG